MELIEDLGRVQPTPTSNYKVRYGIYKCGMCGTVCKASTEDVKAGKIVSCGCYHKKRIKEANTTHGLRYHELYNKWKAMRNRCVSPTDQSYKYYGGRGITVCDEWLKDPETFFEWCYTNGYEKNLSLDRIDNDLGYNPDNCRFTTKSVQSRNTRILQSNNKSGYRGVSWSKVADRWKAQIVVSGKTVRVGMFEGAIEAARAYDKYVQDNSLEHTINGV